jgi:four helix bundle protein
MKMTQGRVQGTELRAQEKTAPAATTPRASYRDLTVWQRSIQLSVSVYKLTAGFPREELYGLTSQLRRAAVSVASNLAEGYGRASKGEYRQFVGMARGSVLELQTQLVIARELRFGETAKLKITENLAEETGKMTWALFQKL